MSAQDKLCMSCMRSVPRDAKSCPHCGYNGTQNNSENCLRIGTRLKGGRYVVGMRAESDGDTIAYIAFDCKTNTAVFIREFFLKGGCARASGEISLCPTSGAELQYKTGLMDFCELYRGLSRLGDSVAVVRTIDFFEANGTAYAVFERFSGIPLRELLSKAGGTISFEQAYALLEPVGAALTEIHSVNLIHRGVSPSTIFINRNGDVRLGGFASSSVRTRGSDVSAKLQSGYSAPEQYSVEMWQSTSTDVYSLAAVMYRCVTGTTPPDAEQRRSYDTLESAASLNNSVTQRVSRAISMGMLINLKERTETVEDFFAALFVDAAARVPEVSCDTIVMPAMAAKKRVERTSDAPVRSAQRDDAASQPVKKDKDFSIQKKAGLPWYGIALVVLAVAAVCVVMFIVGRQLLDAMPKDPDDGQSTSEVLEGKVPDYVGQNVNAIVKDDKLFTYAYEFVVEADNDENTIVRQSPEAGTAVKSENGDRIEITLYVSKGKRVAMIEVVGSRYAEAEKSLNALGIKVVKIDEETASYAEGTVLRQSIDKGALVDPASQSVTLYVASAPAADPEAEGQDNE